MRKPLYFTTALFLPVFCRGTQSRATSQRTCCAPTYVIQMTNAIAITKKETPPDSLKLAGRCGGEAKYGKAFPEVRKNPDFCSGGTGATALIHTCAYSPPGLNIWASVPG